MSPEAFLARHDADENRPHRELPLDVHADEGSRGKSARVRDEVVGIREIHHDLTYREQPDENLKETEDGGDCPVAPPDEDDPHRSDRAVADAGEER